jgi:hypothetical protein
LTFLQVLFHGKRKNSKGWTDGHRAARRAPIRHQIKEIKVNRILASAFAFASTVTAVISIGATASGNACAQPLGMQASTVNPTVEASESNSPEIKTAKPLLTQHSGSAYYGPFGEPPLVMKDTAVMGGAAMPAAEPSESNLPEIKTAKPLLAQHSGSAYFGPFGEPPLVIKDTAVMGGAAMPAVESSGSNFPEIKTAK